MLITCHRSVNVLSSGHSDIPGRGALLRPSLAPNRCSYGEAGHPRDPNFAVRVARGGSSAARVLPIVDLRQGGPGGLRAIGNGCYGNNVLPKSRPVRSVGDAHRREILRLLSEGDLAVGQFADSLPISRPAVSRHLRLFKEAGMVSERAEGTRRIYHLQE